MSQSHLSEPRSAYIHVPFCAHRCGYCDFTLVAGRDELIDNYLQALEIELSALQRPRPVETLYFGGGTPSHLPAGPLNRLLELVLCWLPPKEGCEFSVEANPAGLDTEKINLLADAGVNRLSLGVQSFAPSVLEVLERDHRAGEVIGVVENIRSRIDNISFDLIFGVPGQTLSLWRQTLQQAIQLQPQHLSTYGLTFEKGTSFWSRRRKGELIGVPVELEREMYAVVMDELPAAGFEQYEISSFARLGSRCRHNETYWQGLSYYGFGPGAARYLGGRREINHRSVTTWLRRILSGQSPVGESEELSDEERARETLMLALRCCEGVAKEEFRRRTGFAVESLTGEAIGRYLGSGLLEETVSHIRLTRQGHFLADTVFVDLL